MVRPAPNSASFETSSANVSMVRPAPNVTSVNLSSSNVSMVRPAQSSLALSPAVNSGQRSKSAKTRTDKGCVDIPVAVTIPSDGPSPILSLTSEALSKTHSHLSDGESFKRLSYIDSTPYSTEGSPRTEGPDSNKPAPNSGGEEEPSRNNWGNEPDDGQPDLKNETEAEMDVSLEKYARQERANTRIPKKTYQMTSYEELDEPRYNNRSQQSSQLEREADPHSQDGSYTEFIRNQSVDDTRESNQYHDTDDYDTRDSTNSPRIIDYRDMNRDTQSRNNKSQYGGGTQPTNISRSHRGQNNRPSNSTNQFHDDPRENKGYSRVLDNSNQYQDDRISIQITATTDTPMIQKGVATKPGIKQLYISTRSKRL